MSLIRFSSEFRKFRVAGFDGFLPNKERGGSARLLATRRCFCRDGQLGADRAPGAVALYSRDQDAAVQNLDDARELAGDESQREGDPEEAVADKGYHSKMVLLALRQEGWRTYIAEPQRGRQKWTGQEEHRAAVYANRRRKNGPRGRALMRLRGELIERPFAHAFETGGMRRTHLRHHENIAKRLLVDTAGLNLALLMRTRFGFGKPRCLQGLAPTLWARLLAFLHLLRAMLSLGWPILGYPWLRPSRVVHASDEPRNDFQHGLLEIGTRAFAAGCRKS